MFYIVPSLKHIFVWQYSNTMIQIIKTTVLASSIFLMSFTPAPQGDIHTQYASKNGVTAFSFSKDMIDAIDFDMDINDRMNSVKGDLTSIKFLTFNDYSQSNWEGLLKDLKKSGYGKIDWEGNKDSNNDILPYVDRNGKRFNEIHFITFSNEKPKTMISFYGDITVKDHK